MDHLARFPSAAWAAAWARWTASSAEFAAFMLVCGGAGTRGSGLDGRRRLGLALVRLSRFSLSLSPGLSEAPGGVQTVASSREDLSGGDREIGEPGRFGPRR